jgi:hypothetical protein
MQDGIKFTACHIFDPNLTFLQKQRCQSGFSKKLKLGAKM